ncbi:MAG: hypothetical protein QNK37_35910 [Acidobacteriota bacterium]|nr:hypothetical protein [Acidobacteriota bacterium]
MKTDSWHDDWRYKAIFRKVEDDWKICRLSKGSRNWRYVLVEEYMATGNMVCPYTLVRAWVRNHGGLHEISLTEHARRKRKMIDRLFYPFILFSFRIDPEQGLVMLSESGDRRCGIGAEFRFQGAGETATLKPKANWLV